MAIRVQAEDFDVGAELAALTDGDRSIGGVTSFVGLVREMGNGPSAMTLEHYPGMTERQLAEIEAEAHAAGLSVAFHEHASDGTIVLTRPRLRGE
jgi:molybdopterin synthase catalytic subunit